MKSIIIQNFSELKTGDICQVLVLPSAQVWNPPFKLDLNICESKRKYYQYLVDNLRLRKIIENENT